MNKTERLPEYLKRPIIDTEKTKTVRHILKDKCLNTVCESARCPNKGECYSKNTATFLIMGKFCTRNCKYCNISPSLPEPLDLNEPVHIAEAVKELGLKYVVITSVTRDDLPDGGAGHFASCIAKIQELTPEVKVEILTPDFGVKKHSKDINTDALDIIISAKPNVFNHNIETVKSLFKEVRPQGNYERSLRVLEYIKDKSGITTKSGLMVGLGESPEDIEHTLLDLKQANVDIITIGQYIQPSKQHYKVVKYYTPDDFEELKKLAEKIGFANYQINPLVRSSYEAAKSWQSVVVETAN